MDSGTKQLLIVMVALFLVVSTIVWSLVYYNVATTKAAMENGYTMEVIPGSSSPQWVKH